MTRSNQTSTEEEMDQTENTKLEDTMPEVS